MAECRLSLAWRSGPPYIYLMSNTEYKTKMSALVKAWSKAVDAEDVTFYWDLIQTLKTMRKA